MYRHPSPVRRPVQQAAKPTRQASYPGSTIAPSDPLYGHGETALLCQRFIRSLFNCPDRPPPSSTQPSTSTPPLAQFVAYSLHRTRLHPSVTFTALFLLSRLKSRFPQARGSSGHRLFISAFMIASKVVCDDTYSNKSWTVVGQGMFSLREINQMEREMCGYLEWQLNVDPKELRDFEIRVRKDYAPNGPCPPFVHPPQPVPTTTVPTVDEDTSHPMEITHHHTVPSQTQSGPITPPASPRRLPPPPPPPPVAVHPPSVHVQIPTASTTPPLGARESPSPQSSGGCLTPQSDDEDRDDTTIVSMGPEFPVSDEHPSRTHSAMSINSAASLPPKSKLGRDQSFAFPSRTVW